MTQIPGVADHAHPKESAVKKYKKAIAAACGVAAMVVSTGVLEENAEIFVNAALALATTYGVYQARNQPTPPAV